MSYSDNLCPNIDPYTQFDLFMECQKFPTESIGLMHNTPKLPCVYIIKFYVYNHKADYIRTYLIDFYKPSWSLMIGQVYNYTESIDTFNMYIYTTFNEFYKIYNSVREQVNYLNSNEYYLSSKLL